MRRIPSAVLIVFLGMYFLVHELVSPVQATLTLDASVSVGESYTNNLFFTFADKRDDFGTFVNPRVTLEYESEYVVVAGTYSGTGQFYVKNSEANTYINGANFNFDLPFLTKRFDQLEVTLNESFNVTPQLPAFSSLAADQSFGATGTGAGSLGLGSGGGLGGGVDGSGRRSLSNQGVITGRSSTAYQNRAGFTATYHFTPSVSQSFDYTNRIQEFTSSQFQDSITHKVSTKLDVKVNPKTTFNTGYVFQRVNFDGGGTSTSQAPGGVGEGTSHSGRVGLNHQLTSTIPINAHVGITYTNTETRSDRINFTGGAGISKAYPDGEASFRYRQQIGNGGGLAAATTLSQTVFLRVNKLITRDVSVFGSFGFGRNTSLAGPAIDLITYQGNGGVSIAILSWLNGVGSYSYQNQDSSGTFGNTAQSHNFFVGLTATALPWRIFK